MSAIFVRRARLICALTVVVVAGALSGCATGPIGAHQPSIANVEQLRESGMEAIAVGEFEIAPGVKPQIDKGVSVRGSQLRSPANGSFA